MELSVSLKEANALQDAERKAKEVEEAARQRRKEEREARKGRKASSSSSSSVSAAEVEVEIELNERLMSRGHIGDLVGGGGGRQGSSSGNDASTGKDKDEDEGEGRGKGKGGDESSSSGGGGGGGGDVDDENSLKLYGEWQTRAWKRPGVDPKTGALPRNASNSVDVWDGDPRWVPSGAAHIRDTADLAPAAVAAGIPPDQVRVARSAVVTASHAATQIGVDHAPAFVGFEFKRGVCVPRYDGIVVRKELAAAVVETMAQLRQQKIEAAAKKRTARVKKRWRRLVHGLRVKAYVQLLYGKGKKKKEKKEKKEKGKRKEKGKGKGKRKREEEEEEGGEAKMEVEVDAADEGRDGTGQSAPKRSRKRSESEEKAEEDSADDEVPLADVEGDPGPHVHTFVVSGGKSVCSVCGWSFSSMVAVEEF